MRTETLEIKYGTSRGRDTYGYTLVTLYVRGQKVAKASGGGYDMVGTVLADYIEQTFQSALMKIKSQANHVRGNKPAKTNEQGLYGMTLLDYPDEKRIVLDGACGVSSIQKIAEAIGLKLRSTWTTSRASDIYLLEIPAKLDKQ